MAPCSNSTSNKDIDETKSPPNDEEKIQKLS